MLPCPRVMERRRLCDLGQFIPPGPQPAPPQHKVRHLRSPWRESPDPGGIPTASQGKELKLDQPTARLGTFYDWFKRSLPAAKHTHTGG